MLIRLIDARLFLVNFDCSWFLKFSNLASLYRVGPASRTWNSLTSIFIKQLGAFQFRNSCQKPIWLS